MSTLATPPMLTLRIFIASPGDVAEERRMAVETIRELEDSYLLRDRVRLQVVAWDDPAARAPMDARETPQRSVQHYAGRPADCDLTLVALWSRIGTPLPAGMTRADGSRFASGTVWEVEDALAADRPVFVYRRTEKPRIDVDDPQFESKRAQFEALSGWFAGFERGGDGSLRAGINDYAAPAEFRSLLRQHLEAFIGRRLQEADRDAAVPATPPSHGPARASASATPTRPDDATVQAVPAPTSATAYASAASETSRPRGSSRWFLPAAGAALAIAALLAWTLWPSTPPTGHTTAPTTGPTAATAPSVPATPAPAGGSNARAAPGTAAAVAAKATAPRVRLPENPTVRFAKGSSPATITLLDVGAAAGTSTYWTLSLRVRMAIPENGSDANFWDSDFRLLQDGVPRAPSNVLGEIVQRGTSKEGELTYAVPYGTQSLAVRIWHLGDSADLPLGVEGAGPAAEAFAFPPGPRRVLVDGPAEVKFTGGTRVTYTLLAAATEARRPGVLGLRLRMRMTVLDGGGGANFWDSNFRLVVDGEARPPDSNLNELVDARAAKDADISFELPEAVRTLVLRIRRSDTESADIPLRIEAAR